MAVRPRSRRSSAARVILVCTGLLVVNFIVGVVSFARCTDAGDSCSTANEWIDTVTITLAGLLVVVIVVGSLADVIGRFRIKGHR
jgi:hypothetical protein